MLYVLCFRPTNWHQRIPEGMSKGENIVKWIKVQRVSWMGHLERMEEDRMRKKENWKGRDEEDDLGKDG